MQSLWFSLREPEDAQAVLQALSQDFGLRRDPPREVTQVVLDTFDWRLYNNDMSLILIREDRRLLLHDLRTGLTQTQTELESVPPPSSWRDLPEAEVRSRLRPLLDVRALLPVMTLTVKRRAVRVLNRDNKTVAALSLETWASRTESGFVPALDTILLIPLLGYDSEQRKVRRILSQAGLKEEGEDVLISLMKRLGLEPGGYTSKFRITLDADLPAAEAEMLIIRRLIEVIRKNEHGLIADIDTEFLHDFRVAVRRIRSALRQMKGVLPKSTATRFRSEFTAIGRSTNRLRDLDVYLLDQDRYRSLLPPELAPGLDRFFRDLTIERDREHRKVRRFLESEGYRRILERWESFAESPPDLEAPDSPGAARPILPTAKDLIFKRYTKIVSAGRKITDGSPAEDLHRLRISCKRLRYLLEFFVSLFPEKDIARLIGQLKKLQDNLGEFNDLSVQQGQLREHLERLKQAGDAGPLTAAALGGLITLLHQRQKAVRLDFRRRFRSFGGRKNRVWFQRLFAPGSAAGDTP